MLIDKNSMFADKLAYNGTPTAVDLGSDAPGPGEELTVFFTVHSALTGATGFTLKTGATSSPATVIFTSGALPAAGDTIEVTVPSSALRYLTVGLAGTATAGNYSAGIVSDVQTNQ